MDNAYHNAVRRRAKLLNQIKEIELFLELYERFRGTNGEESETASTTMARQRLETPPVVDSLAALGKKRRGNPSVIADAAERVLRAAGRPMVRSEIASALEAGGIKIPSDDKGRYVGTVLWRHQDRFTSIDGQGYWLVGEDIPSAPDARPGAAYDDEDAI